MATMLHWLSATACPPDRPWFEQSCGPLSSLRHMERVKDDTAGTPSARTRSRRVSPLACHPHVESDQMKMLGEPLLPATNPVRLQADEEHWDGVQSGRGAPERMTSPPPVFTAE